MDIFHKWITIDFRDKLSNGNPRVSGGQVDRDRTGKMSSRKISVKWASVGTRLKRLRRTGGAGGIIIIIIIVYDARRQQNHTDKTPKTQNYTTMYK